MFALAYLGYYTALTPFNQSVVLLFSKIVPLYIKTIPTYKIVFHTLTEVVANCG